jgi:hypothetical protein
MAARKVFLGSQLTHPELDRLLERARTIRVTDDQLREQGVSFAYGSAPVDSNRITKESVRDTSRRIRLTKE